MKIIPATSDDWAVIRDLAHAIWPSTYQDVIPADQIDYMLHRGYSEDAIQQQVEEGHRFYLVLQSQEPIGFFSWQPITTEQAKLQKLYVLPASQGKGTGTKLLEKVKELTRQEGYKQLILNVNRSNPAVGFYEKVGGKRLEEVDIPYGPYVLNDYVYGWELT
ncbi:MAG: GNAT family N-acetyltransferase [Spirosomataceae bacterium]